MCNIFLFLFCYIMIFYTFELIELIINIIEKEKKLTKENFERKFVNTNSIAKGHIFQSILWSIPWYSIPFVTNMYILQKFIQNQPCFYCVTFFRRCISL